ncbi:MAG: hypothetical protein ACR5LF_01660 [Symbiopectobacterium sp.]
MWTRFFPVYRQVREWLDADAIGPVRMVSADFGFRREGPAGDRKMGLHRCGGALIGCRSLPHLVCILGFPAGTIHDHRCC